MPNVSRTLTSHTLQTSRYYKGIFSESNKKEEDVSNLRFFQIKKNLITWHHKNKNTSAGITILLTKKF